MTLFERCFELLVELPGFLADVCSLSSDLQRRYAGQGKLCGVRPWFVGVDLRRD